MATTKEQLDNLKGRLSALENSATGDNSEVLSGLRSILAEQQRVADTLERLTVQMGKLEIAKGPPAPVSPDEYRRITAKDPMARFRVLEDYRHGGQTLRRGREMQSNLHPRLVDHIQAGLKLTPSETKIGALAS